VNEFPRESLLKLFSYAVAALSYKRRRVNAKNRKQLPIRLP
jgi:hypothetical protein